MKKDTTDLQAKSNIKMGCFLIKKNLKLKETIKGLEINLKARRERQRKLFGENE